MNRAVLLFFFIVAANLLTAQQLQPKIDSVIFRKADMKLTFYSDNTYKYVIYPCDICPRIRPGNVWSFGTYQKDKKGYYLFSDESLSTKYWGQKAKESVADNDSLTFRFHIPRHNDKNQIDNDWIFFQVVLYLQPDSTEKETRRPSMENDPNIKAFYTDDVVLTIPKPANEIWSFDVNVYSVNRNAHCSLNLQYVIENPIADVFDLDLPMVTPEFFIYQRYFCKEVTLLDENAVQLDNDVLLRDGAFKKEDYTNFTPLPKKYWKYVNGSIEAGIRHFHQEQSKYSKLEENAAALGDVRICDVHIPEDDLYDVVNKDLFGRFGDDGIVSDSCLSTFVDTLFQRYLKTSADDYYLGLLDEMCQIADGWIAEYMAYIMGELFDTVPDLICYYLYDNWNQDNTKESSHSKMIDYLNWALSGNACKAPSKDGYLKDLKSRLWKLIPERNVRNYISKVLIIEEL